MVCWVRWLVRGLVGSTVINTIHDQQDSSVLSDARRRQKLERCVGVYVGKRVPAWPAKKWTMHVSESFSDAGFAS